MICGRRQKSVVENLSVCWPHSLLGNLQSEIDSVAFCFLLPVNAPGYEITRECLRPEIADPQAARAVARAGARASSGIDVAHGVNFYDEVRRFEIDLIRRALDQTGGHQSRAARLLGEPDDPEFED